MAAVETITLKGLRFHVLVGVLPHEREFPQPLEIDLVVERSTDGAGLVLDYRDLYEVVRSRVAAAPLRYLEELGHAILGDALALAGVDRARVAMRKPHVALPGPLAYAEVAIERARDA